MSLNIALTGINAANTDLSVVSDNIANANTTGFKKARAEFGDLVDSMSRDSNGLGVRLQRLSQTFTQGSIEDTGRTFDMAITGEGFFILKGSNEITTYSRAGNFSLNADGFIVNNSEQKVQGYEVISIETQATSQVNYDVALDSNASVVANPFLPRDSSSYNSATSLAIYDSAGIQHELKTYFRKTAANTWEVHYTLDNLPPKQLTNNVVFDSSTGLISSGNSQIISFTPADLGSTLVSDSPPAVTEELGITLDFTKLIEGVDGFNINDLSSIPISRATRRLSNNGDVSLIDLRIDPNEHSIMVPKITSEASLNLNLSALEQESRPTTLATFDIKLDSGASAPTTSPFDPTDSTSYNYSTAMQVYDSDGYNHTLETYFVYTGAGTDWDIYHTLDKGTTYPAYAQQPAVAASLSDWTLSDVAVPTDTTAGTANPTTFVFTAAQLGTGAEDLVIEMDYTNIKLGAATTNGDNHIINRLLANTQSTGPDSVDPTDTSTFNYSTAMTVYDSIGIDHTMNLFFRKIADNNWGVYYQAGGQSSSAEKVGVLTFDSRGLLIRATDSNGIVDELNPLKLDIIGIQFSQGAARQNITLDFSETSQFDSASITSSLEQDGYTSGALTGTEVDSSGKLIGSYSNGQTQELGQVALARFTNTQGLKRIGDNQWIYTTDAGTITRAAAGSLSMGQLITGALEGSNVELTNELVDMITAQRSFQANAQVINTTGTLYQAILNIR